MSRPAWQIQQQRLQQQRQIQQSWRNHQEGIGHTLYQQQSGHKGRSGLTTAAVGAGIGGVVGGPVGVAIGSAVGWLFGKLR